MVSFVSISKGVFFVSMMFIGTSHAAPPSSEVPSDVPQDNSAKHSNFTLPPLITNRTHPAPPHLKVAGVGGEVQNMEDNIEWLKELGFDYPGMIQRQELESVHGMAIDLPAGVPAISAKDTLSRFDNGNDISIAASPEQINTLAFYAGVTSTSYCRTVTGLGRWDCKNCQKYVPDGQLIFTFSSPISDTTGFVLRSDSQKTIHVVFRGTNSIRQSITDLVTTKTDYPPVNGAQVHTGFLASYNEVADKYFPYVQQQLSNFPNYKVVVSGHSLGGAHALLAALDLYQRDSRFGPNNMSVYTVGCPRVGDTSFAYYVDATRIPFYRSVHNRDPVPHLPPQAMGFLHAGVEIWDKTLGGYSICPTNLESQSCSNTIVPIVSFFDHLTYYDINEGLCL
ncbi:lipase [Mucor mucedo]|uniref:lipase n=1 Tax=Mucor mucedo TaxID=29922 RepID=UPI00221E87F7|nr:lipase [Mucor mucedo]KAI7892789.1 lipase [Mucor mucedo]